MLAKLLFNKYVAKKTQENRYKKAKQERKESYQMYLQDKQIFENELHETSDNTKELFKQLMQQRRLSRQNILNFNKLIDNCLGRYAEEYNKKKYKNDAHKIYTKLQSYVLTQNDYREITNYLRQF